MTEEATVNDLLTAQAPEPPREFRGGVIKVYNRLLKDLGIDITGCTIQGEFADKGVFAELQKKLLLPASYTIRGIFYSYWENTWDIVVESPDLPPVDLNSYPPAITPIYEKLLLQPDHLERGYRLKEIRIENRWQRTYSPDELTPERL